MLTYKELDKIIDGLLLQARQEAKTGELLEYGSYEYTQSNNKFWEIMGEIKALRGIYKRLVDDALEDGTYSPSYSNREGE